MIRGVESRPFALVLPIAMLTAGLLSAQANPPPASPECAPEALLPPLVKGALCTIGSMLQRPLHPIVKGIAPGGGIGAGLEYDAPIRGPWLAGGRAVVTPWEYWSGEVAAGYRGSRARVEAYGRLRDMSRLSFFGIGAQSTEANHTDFRLEDRVVGVLGSVRVVPWITVGGRVEGSWPEVSRGRSSLPSIEERFDEPTAPGLTSQPRQMRYQASLDIQVPAVVGEAFYQGTKYRIAYAVFADQELDRFDFRRLDIEAQQRFALLAPQHRLTLHGWLSLSYTDAGQEVPFYLLNSLGGRWNLRSVHDDLIGSDGTQATLRGFRTFRFRDRNLLLLQTEYRMPLWGPVEASVFADAGKVTSLRSDLDLRDLQHNVGFALSLMRGPLTAARVDVGLGGEEGIQVFITIRRDLVP